MDKDDVKKLVRDIGDIKQYLELVYKEREVLEDIQGSIKHLQEIILQNQNHQDNNKKDLKADVKDIQNIVESKVDEVKQEMDTKTVIIKSSKENIFSKLKKILNI